MKKARQSSYAFQTVGKPLGGIGEPQPSDFGSETGGVYVGFAAFRSKAFLTLFAARRAAGEQAKSASRQKRSPSGELF